MNKYEYRINKKGIKQRRTIGTKRWRKCCKIEDCKSRARSPTDYCKKHGGGKRCKEKGCKSSARSQSDYCVAHGGGKRCKEEGCKSAAQSPTDYCVAHGGGKRCKKEGCKSAAISPTNYCVAHGGGKRCEGDACSIYEQFEKRHANYKGSDNKYYCYNCFNHLFPEMVTTNGFIRQEHLILAEIQRLMDHFFSNAMKCMWDCNAPCTLRRPDLLYELNNINVLVL